eukprot:jgi/Mesvir1/6094/Mv00811-RA.1
MAKKRKVETKEEEGKPQKAAAVEVENKPSTDGAGHQFRNKEKVLVLSSRGIGSRHRHIMNDMLVILPNTKRDVKVEHTKDNLTVLNEIADLKGCSSCLFFEVRKRKDLYLWMTKTPNGPSAKFHVTNVHTMSELKLTGNHLKGSRPFLSFHAAFDGEPYLQMLKEMFTQVFTTPRGHRKAKPFFDHVFAFSFLDGHIWFRNYQIVYTPLSKGTKVEMDGMSLVEVGPRFCLNPIKIFASSFCGATLYQNPDYVSPNVIRAMEKRAKSAKYATKVKHKAARREHKSANKPVPTELDTLFK